MPSLAYCQFYTCLTYLHVAAIHHHPEDRGNEDATELKQTMQKTRTMQQTYDAENTHDAANMRCRKHMMQQISKTITETNSEFEL